MDLMDGKEAAKYINVFSYWTLLDLVKRGSIPHIRVGKRIFFRRDSIDQWLKDLETGGCPKEETPDGYGKLRKIQA